MSTDYYLACHKCCETIHIAQDGFSGWGFYSHEPECMKALSTFLNEHQQHPLQLVPEYLEDDLADKGYKRVEWSGSPVTLTPEKDNDLQVQASVLRSDRAGGIDRRDN